MAKGRKAVPKNLKMLRGTYRSDRDGGGVKVKAYLPEPPEWMPDIGKEEWERIAKELYELELLTRLDVVALEMYCSVYARWKKAEFKLLEMEEGEVSRTPNGYQQMSAWMLIYNNCFKQLQSAAGMFGLTPADRARMKVAADAPKQLDLESFMKQMAKSKAAANG